MTRTRTTVALDADVAAKLRAEMRRLRPGVSLDGDGGLLDRLE